MADGTTKAIGKILAQLQGEFPDISASKIRYLESQGLVTPDRTDSGYRTFDEDDVATLRWVLRQQRDHFLPLKVIKARLREAGGVPAEAAAASATAPRPRTGPAVAAVEGSVSFSLTELAQASGLATAQLEELERFGLIDGVRVQRKMVYDHHALLTARLAARFADYGVEPRHLRMFKVAAEREAGVLEQAISSRKGEELDELVGLGSQMRLTLLRQLLHDDLR